MVDRFAAAWRAAGLDAATTEMLAYTEKLTAEPGKCGPMDVQRLRDVGWDDRGIHDITQVCSYFNYINRIADGLGVEAEDWIDALGRELADPPR